MSDRTSSIGGKCGTCGDTLEVKGDDAAVDRVWAEFRKLHQHALVEPPVLSRAALDAEILKILDTHWRGVRWLDTSKSAARIAMTQLRDAILESLSQEDGE